MNVSNCFVTPTSIALGGQATLTIIIDQPAPASDLGVIIDVTSNGSQDTLLDSPVAITINAGQTQGSILLQTSTAASNPATQIIFTAHVGSGIHRSAQLVIS
jgi:hypothetical protein